TKRARAAHVTSTLVLGTRDPEYIPPRIKSAIKEVKGHPWPLVRCSSVGGHPIRAVKPRPSNCFRKCSASILDGKRTLRTTASNRSGSTHTVVIWLGSC